MDEQEQAQQALMESFRRERAKVAAHPPRKPRWQPGPVARRWFLAVVVVAFILTPLTIILVYPRFGPVDTMTAFCQAEGEGDYNTAYGLLSSHAQDHVSPDAFAQASRGVNLLYCQPNHGIPFIFGGTRASLDAGYHFLDGSEQDGSMTFVRDEHGNWRVDSMTPDLFQLSS